MIRLRMFAPRGPAGPVLAEIYHASAGCPGRGAAPLGDALQTRDRSKRQRLERSRLHRRVDGRLRRANGRDKRTGPHPMVTYAAPLACSMAPDMKRHSLPHRKRTRLAISCGAGRAPGRRAMRARPDHAATTSGRGVSMRPGHDAIDRDIVARELGGERAGHAGKPGLGGRHVAAVGAARMGGAAADIDDGAAAELAHQRHAGLDAEEAAVERGRKRVAPFLAA